MRTRVVERVPPDTTAGAALMDMDEHLHQLAWQLQHHGHDWSEVAAELGCDETVARAMADRYLADTESRAQKDQFSLFDL